MAHTSEELRAMTDEEFNPLRIAVLQEQERRRRVQQAAALKAVEARRIATEIRNALIEYRRAGGTVEDVIAALNTVVPEWGQYVPPGVVTPAPPAVDPTLPRDRDVSTSP